MIVSVFAGMCACVCIFYEVNAEWQPSKIQTISFAYSIFKAFVRGMVTSDETFSDKNSWTPGLSLFFFFLNVRRLFWNHSPCEIGTLFKMN